MHRNVRASVLLPIQIDFSTTIPYTKYVKCMRNCCISMTIGTSMGCESLKSHVCCYNSLGAGESGYKRRCFVH